MIAVPTLLSSLLFCISRNIPCRSISQLAVYTSKALDKMSSQSKIVVVGSANYDLNAYCQSLPQDGETLLGKDFYTCPGGKGANQAVAAALLRRNPSNVHIICRVGRDAYGSALLDNFKKSGVLFSSNTSQENMHTGVASITVNSQGDNCIIVIPGANEALDVASVQKELESIIKDSYDSIVMTQLEIPLDVAMASLKTGKENHALTILNPAPAVALDTNSFKYIDIIIPNEHELRKLVADPNVSGIPIQQMAEKLLDMGINKAVIVTLGEKGAFVAQRSSEGVISFTTVASPLDVKKENVIDTVGAGDAFCGALSVYLSSGLDILDAASKACGVAGISVQSKGAQRSYPKLEELPEILKTGLLITDGTPVVKKHTITFVTGNKKKLAEVQQILSSDDKIQIVSAKLDLPELQGDPCEIAIEKCKLAAKMVEGPVFVEDTSLCFNSLNGLPGPYIKWFLEKCGHDGLNRMLNGFDDRSAYAQTVIAFTQGDNDEIHVFDGRTDGIIVEARGSLDFGWDPIFQPFEGGGFTYAEMKKEKKNEISHRARAFAKFQEFLFR